MDQPNPDYVLDELFGDLPGRKSPEDQPSPVNGNSDGMCICPDGECLAFNEKYKSTCQNKATEEDLLCDPCRRIGTKNRHCHPCTVRS